jgi:2-succinyl-6-hydroxy-2,4-cyclohexadiene-1-carboxylate synthase
MFAELDGDLVQSVAVPGTSLSTMITFLLHGFSGDKSSWDEVIRHWQPDQPPVAIDLPGHGGCPQVQDGWTANLHAIGHAIGPALADATVVGYSLGARVALGLVVAGLAKRAVLVSVNPGLAAHERPARRASDAEWIQMLRSEGIERFATRWGAQPLFESQSRVPAELRHRRHLVRCAQSTEALARSLEEMGLAAMPDYREALRPFSDRLQLVVGAEDSKFGALAERMVSMAPSIPLHRFAACGHDVPLERPEALGELLSALARATW